MSDLVSSENLRQDIHEFIVRCGDGRDRSAERNALLSRLFRFQYDQNPVYRRFAQALGVGENDVGQNVLGFSDSELSIHGSGCFPALPTEVFRFARVAVYPQAQDRIRFRTSGTRNGRRGEHVFRDLTTYDLAAKTAASIALFREPVDRIVALAPSFSATPDSSLSYMMERFGEWFSEQPTLWILGPNTADLLKDTLTDFRTQGYRVGLLGTAFSYAQVLEQPDRGAMALLGGSVLMFTGGYKGRATPMEPSKFRRMLSQRFHLPENRIVGEYGMTELSSQLYQPWLMDPELAGDPELYWSPPWVRVSVVDPHSLAPVAVGQTGVLRVDDLANVDSVAAVLTSDLAHCTSQGIVLVGRDPEAVPRGCSLAAEEVELSFGSLEGVNRL